MPNPVVHFEVLGKDAEALQGFYGKVFDWQLNPVMPTYAMVSTGVEGGIAGGVGAPPDGSAGHVTFYVRVPDIDATLETATKLGGRVIMPKFNPSPDATLALVADPEGHIIGLSE